MPGARSVGRITACGYPPALQGIGGYRLWRYSPYGTFERASCLLLKLFSVPALASCFAFPGEFLLQASKRNQKTRPGIRPQPLLGWGALAASLLPAARRHGPSWTEAALAASCHSSPSATIPLGLLTGRVCRPTTWRASLTSCMPGTRSGGRITASGYSLYGSGLRYVEVWHARGHPPPEAPLSPIESFRSPPAPHARRYSPARPPTGTTARRRAPSTAGRSATVCSSAGPSRESGCNARSR